MPDLASLSFDIDSSQAQRAISVLETLKASSIAVTQSTQTLRTATTDVTQAYGQERDALVRLADQTKAYDGTLAGLITQLNKTRTAIGGVNAEFAAYAGVMRQATAIATTFNATIEGLDRYVTKARDLKVQVSDLATGFQRMTAALQNQTSEGHQTRIMLEQLGVSLQGLGPQQGDALLQRLADTLRNQRDTAQKIAQAQQILGPSFDAQAVQSLQNQPYKPYWTRQEEDRNRGTQAQIDSQQANLQRLTVQIQRNEAERSDLASRFTLNPTLSGRLGLTGTGLGISADEQRRRLQQIEQLPSDQRRPYEQIGFQIGQAFDQSGITRAIRNLTSGTYSSNQAEIGVRAQLDSAASPYGALGALGGRIGRSFQNLVGTYQPLQTTDQRELSEGEKLYLRQQAGGVLAQYGDTSLQNRTQLQEQLRQFGGADIRQRYTQGFGEEEGARRFTNQRSQLERQLRYATEPAQQTLDQVQREQRIQQFAPEQRSQGRFQLQFLEQQGVPLTEIAPGTSLQDLLNDPRLSATAQRAGQTQFRQQVAGELKTGPGGTEDTERQVRFQAQLAEALTKGRAAAEDFTRAWGARNEALLAGADRDQQATRALDALNLANQQRITQGQALVQSMKEENQNQSEQLALNRQLTADGADPIARIAAQRRLQAEQATRAGIRGGTLPDPASTPASRAALANRLADEPSPQAVQLADAKRRADAYQAPVAPPENRVTIETQQEFKGSVGMFETAVTTFTKAINDSSINQLFKKLDDKIAGRASEPAPVEATGPDFLGRMLKGAAGGVGSVLGELFGVHKAAAAEILPGMREGAGLTMAGLDSTAAIIQARERKTAAADVQDRSRTAEWYEPTIPDRPRDLVAEDAARKAAAPPPVTAAQVAGDHTTQFLEQQPGAIAAEAFKRGLSDQVHDQTEVLRLMKEQGSTLEQATRQLENQKQFNVAIGETQAAITLAREKGDTASLEAAQKRLDFVLKERDAVTEIQRQLEIGAQVQRNTDYTRQTNADSAVQQAINSLPPEQREAARSLAPLLQQNLQAGGVSVSPQLQDRGTRLIKRFQADLGVTPEGAAGLASNAAGESKIQPIEQDPRSLAGGRGPGHGDRGGINLFQFTAERRDAFLKFAADNRLDPYSEEAGIQFAEHELKTRYKPTLDKLRTPGLSATQQAATVAREYVVPPGGADTQHVGYAQPLLEGAQGGKAAGTSGQVQLTWEQLRTATEQLARGEPVSIPGLSAAQNQTLTEAGRANRTATRTRQETTDTQQQTQFDSQEEADRERRRLLAAGDQAGAARVQVRNRNIDPDLARREQERGAAAAGNQQGTQQTVVERQTQQSIEDETRRREALTKGYGANRAASRDLEAQLKAEQELRERGAENVNVQTRALELLTEQLSKETTATQQQNQALREELTTRQAVLAAIPQGDAAVRRAQAEGAVAAQLAELEALKAKTSDPNELATIDKKMVALREEVGLRIKLGEVAAQEKAAQDAKGIREQNFVQQGLNARGPFASDLDLAATRRRLELENRFKNEPGLRESQAGQDLVAANAETDRIAKATEEMNDYREAARSASGAIGSAFEQVAIHGGKAGDVAKSLASTLSGIAIHTLVTKPFERLLNEGLTSLFGSDEPGSSGKTGGGQAANDNKSGTAVAGAGGAVGSLLKGDVGGAVNSLTGGSSSSHGLPIDTANNAMRVVIVGGGAGDGSGGGSILDKLMGDASSSGGTAAKSGGGGTAAAGGGGGLFGFLGRLFGKSKAANDNGGANDNAERTAGSTTGGGGQSPALAQDSGDSGGGLFGSISSGISKLLGSGGSSASDPSGTGGGIGGILNHEGGVAGWLIDKIGGEGFYKGGGLIGSLLSSGDPNIAGSTLGTGLGTPISADFPSGFIEPPTPPSIIPDVSGASESFIPGGVADSLSSGVGEFTQGYGSGLSEAFGSLTGAGAGFAKGGVFGPTRTVSAGRMLHDYEHEIVSSPTVFRFAGGGQVGLMGEAGPEAILPLKRGADGRLGISSEKVHEAGGTTHHWHITTPDVDSFMRSRPQIEAKMTMSASRTTQRNSF